MIAPPLITTRRPEETVAVGRVLGTLLRAGDLLALNGPLGAGKTQLMKGVALGLGISADEPIVSPTFVLVREYVGRLKLYHLDAYRLTSSSELFNVGFDEMRADPGAVVALEWAERTPEVVTPAACVLTLSHAGESERTIEVAWGGDLRAEELAREAQRICH